VTGPLPYGGDLVCLVGQQLAARAPQQADQHITREQ
jgi:hypothetical protein